MTVKMTRTVSLGGGGKTTKEQQSITVGQAVCREEITPVAKAGTLSVRTDDNTGTLVLGAGHGITTGARVDVYWSGGKRRGVIVGTVSGTSVPIDLGAGDNLPSASTAILCAVGNEFPILFAGSDLQALFAGSGGRGTIVFADVADAELLHIDIAADGLVYSWDENNGITNPLAGVDVAKVFFSHNSLTTKTQTIIIGLV